MELGHRLDRTVTIGATRETVFRYFTDSTRWAAWWGAGSTIDPRPGGKVYIRHPNGIEVTGEVLEIRGPEFVVFTYGFASGKPIPPGGSRVTIRLKTDSAGTRLELAHEFPEAAVRDEHVQGWRFQLSLFGNVITNEVHAGAAELVDAWFAAWADPDAGRRAETLARIAVPDVRFGDRFSMLYGMEDVMAHITASQKFMPGMRVERRGNVRHCLGTVLVDWSAMGADGQQRATGTNVFALGADGRIQSVTGFWNM